MPDLDQARRAWEEGFTLEALQKRTPGEGEWSRKCLVCGAPPYKELRELEDAVIKAIVAELRERADTLIAALDADRKRLEGEAEWLAEQLVNAAIRAPEFYLYKGRPYWRQQAQKAVAPDTPSRWSVAE